MEDKFPCWHCSKAVEDKRGVQCNECRSYREEMNKLYSKREKKAYFKCWACGDRPLYSMDDGSCFGCYRNIPRQDYLPKR
jgi:DNA-directed RNA polymerase subunit RPC12/RpoP